MRRANIVNLDSGSWLLILAGLLAIISTPIAAAERVLVIGIDYVQADDQSMRLSNPVRDALSIEASLRRAGQENITALYDPDLDDLLEGMQSFASSLGPDDVAIVYYAGHAIQHFGQNYIVASDGLTLLNLGEFVADISGSAHGAVFFIDACRNNPFDIGEGGRSVSIRDAGAVRAIEIPEIEPSRGLTQLGNLRGLSTIVFFSTEPGNVALDGAPGEGSPFAQVLSEEIPRRQSLSDLLRRTAVSVNRETDGQQSPWRQGDIPFDVFLAGMRIMVIP